ncbi:MAG: hypothetical protein HZB71_03155 [Betaproteobacteria bacterium]|nr:hypothetical protein [Betaproteobacteria bacterium]
MGWLRRFLAAALFCLAHGQALAAPQTLAIWDFDNNTPGAMGVIQSVEHLRRVLPEMLLARLVQAPGLKVVERVRLREALEEQKLGSSVLAEQDSRVRLGRILGAKRMVFGDFTLFGGVLRVDVRVVDVETSQVLMSEPINGQIADVLENMLYMADLIAMNLETKLGDAGSVGADPVVWAEYDKGLVQMDARRFDLAVDTFKALLTKHPDFTPAERQIKLALERLARM